MLITYDFIKIINYKLTFFILNNLVYKIKLVMINSVKTNGLLRVL